MPDGYGKIPPSDGVCEFISHIVSLSFIYGPNSSQLQSRLREYSVYFYQAKEFKRAESLAEEYVHIQKILGAKSPLAHGRHVLGDIELALNKNEEAERLLTDAASFYEDSDESEERCQVLLSQAAAFSKTGHSAQASASLAECVKLSKEFQYVDLLKKAQEQSSLTHARAPVSGSPK